MRRPRTPRATVQLLKSLEQRLIALDEHLLLATTLFVGPSFTAPEAPPPKRRLGFQRVEPARRKPRRLRFAPLPPEVDRVVIQNWNPEPGFVPIGDVEVELDPGQAVTLWVKRASPLPNPRPGPPEEPRSNLIFLSDQDTLLL
jgi:hypothetical protein